MQGRFLDIAGFRTHYIDRGSGPIVVLLHGASIAIDAPLTWGTTIEHLAASFRVIAFDQPGFGRTDLPPDGRYLDRLERVEHGLAFLDRLGIERAMLVGHSEGGFMATRIAILRPALVAKLAIVTSGGTAPRLGGDLDRDWMAASQAAYDCHAGAETEDAFIRTSRLLRRTADPTFEQAWRESYARAKAAGQIEMFRRRAAETRDVARYAELQEQQIFPYLAGLAMPVLILWAADDPTVPVGRGLALRRRIPQAEFHVFEGAGHMVMLDRADDFNKLLAAWCGGRDAGESGCAASATEK